MLVKFIGTEIGMVIGVFKLIVKGQFTAIPKTLYVYFMATLQMIWILAKTFFEDLASVVFHPIKTVERINSAIGGLIVQAYAEQANRAAAKEQLNKPKEIQ